MQDWVVASNVLCAVSRSILQTLDRCWASIPFLILAWVALAITSSRSISPDTAPSRTCERSSDGLISSSLSSSSAPSTSEKSSLVSSPNKKSSSVRVVDPIAIWNFPRSTRSCNLEANVSKFRMGDMSAIMQDTSSPADGICW